MAIDTTTMSQIISNVFDEMLQMPTTPVVANEDMDQHRVVAAIRISGCTEELVVVEAPAATARLIGEIMFAADPGTLAGEEVRDAVGEVVNMIGGNVKGTYDGDSQLSLPCVCEDNGVHEPPEEGERIYVNVAGQPLFVRWQDMALSAV